MSDLPPDKPQEPEQTLVTPRRHESAPRATFRLSAKWPLGAPRG